jgi:oxazoline/thiazoline dehydrogenase
VPLQLDQRYQLSRFAYSRRDGEGSTYLESPLAHARLRLERPLVGSVLWWLGKAVTLRELLALLPGEDKEELTGLLAVLVLGKFVFLEGSVEGGEAGEQWEFHDLLFHSRSRLGRHDNPVGGTYRFGSRLAPQPVVKDREGGGEIGLYRPDMGRLCVTDASLTEVLEGRASLREYGEDAVTVRQLGEFLYRVARVKEVEGGELGEWSRRPYPGAGACYELEWYLTIERCEGLGPGFYWYHPLRHALVLVHEANKETERQLADARESVGGDAGLQVLITLAARFQRVSWKYESLAYALILKDVGVVYATMYLVATAMGLAPCALGVGDADLFVRLAGTEYLQETSVGEFLLGSRAG